MCLSSGVCVCVLPCIRMCIIFCRIICRVEKYTMRAQYWRGRPYKPYAIRENYQPNNIVVIPVGVASHRYRYLMYTRAKENDQKEVKNANHNHNERSGMMCRPREVSGTRPSIHRWDGLFYIVSIYGDTLASNARNPEIYLIFGV